MSVDMKLDNKVVPVATEEELLEFANKARAAGGANLLEALLPSIPVEAESCLIANALNFNCSVDKEYLDNSLSSAWCMKFPYNMKTVQAQIIASALDCELFKVDELLVLKLPEHIGNAARAFDLGLAFQQYVECQF